MSGLARGWRGKGRRRARTSPYSDADRRVWLRLVEAATRVAADPTTDKTGVLARTAHEREVIMPTGHQGRESPFAALQALSRSWSTLAPSLRRDRAGELAGLAKRCGEILAPHDARPDPGPLPTNNHVREPRRRADIDD